MNHRKTPVPEPVLDQTTKGQPFSRCKAVRLTRDGRRALNAFGPQLASELGSRHRRMRYLGPPHPGWPEVDMLHAYGGERRAPRASEWGLRYCFPRHHVEGC